MEVNIESEIRQKAKYIAWRLAAAILLALAGAETALMLMLEYLSDLNKFYIIVLDTFLFCIGAILILYYLCYSPLVRYISSEHLLRMDIERSEQRYISILNAMRDMVYICSDDFTVLFFNKAMERRFGKDAVGKKCHAALYGLHSRCPWCFRDEYDPDRAAANEMLDPLDGKFYHVSHSPVELESGRKSMMTVLRDISELYQTRCALEAQLKMNEVVAGLAEALLSAGSLDIVSKLALDASLQLTRSRHGFIGYLDPAKGGFLDIKFSDGIELGCKIPIQNVLSKGMGGLCDRVISSGVPLVVNNVASDARSAGVPDGHFEVKRFLSVPAVASGRIVGQISLANAPDDYTDKDLEAAKRIAALYALGVQRTLMEKALSESEERFRGLAETSIDLIYQISAEGKVEYCSRAVESFLGIDPAGVVGRSLDEFIVEKDRGKIEDAIKVLMKNENLRGLEIRLKKRDGSELPVETNLVSLSDGHSFLGARGIARDKRLQKAAEEALKRSRDELELLVRERTQELASANERLESEIGERILVQKELENSQAELKSLSLKIIEAEEEERKRVARELHDGLGQILGALRFKFDGLIMSIKKHKNKVILDNAEALRGMIKGAAEEVRRISSALRPPMLDDLGVSASIGWLLRQFESSFGIKTDKDITVAESEIPPELKTPIYRIVQEALNNTAKHSGAQRVWISLVRDDGALKLMITDNGRGFASSEPSLAGYMGKGIGLLSMKERAEMSGGVLSIASREGGGAMIKVVWPTDRLSP
jgi:PAS domain S-box-containing protein